MRPEIDPVAARRGGEAARLGHPGEEAAEKSGRLHVARVRVRPIGGGNGQDALHGAEKLKLTAPARLDRRFGRLHAQDQPFAGPALAWLVPSEGESDLELRGAAGQPSRIAKRKFDFDFVPQEGFKSLDTLADGERRLPRSPPPVLPPPPH